ncbi:MAG: hypothetical protein QM764_20205 [Chitinophagaceae bacterium]
MTPNQNKSYSVSIELTESPQRVFSCINEVSKWWSKDFIGNSSFINDEFVIHHPGAHFTRQRLVESIPGKKVVWLVTESKLDWLKKDQ